MTVRRGDTKKTHASFREHCEGNEAGRLEVRMVNVKNEEGPNCKFSPSLSLVGNRDFS